MTGKFGDAGIEQDFVGKDNRFKRTIQHPWVCTLNHEPNLSLYAGIVRKFTVIEETSVDGIHHARICCNMTGQIFDIEIRPDSILVYPTSNNHEEASERLLKIFERHRGKLEVLP